MTLLVKQLASLGDVNFIALTPGTSFDPASQEKLIARARVLKEWTKLI